MKYMNKRNKWTFTITIVLLMFLSIDSVAQEATNDEVKSKSSKKLKKKRKKKKKYKLPEIDLAHWSVTIPELKPLSEVKKGKKRGALSIQPPEVANYATNETLKPYMYNDSTSGALVFYAFPTNATTANTKYSRSELREQMVSGDNHTNWTFADGGYMRAVIQMDEVSKKSNGKYHRAIIAQIHGRLTNEQRDLIGQKDNNAPPILKVYWDNGKIRVKTKVLKYAGVSQEGILHKEAWGDDKGRNFKEKVDFKKFILEVKISDGKMVVSLNKNEFFVYDDISIKRWGVFENYFKAGNYFQSRDEGSYAKVKIYELEATH